MKFSAAVILLVLLPCAFARKFSKCEVAREMYSTGHSYESLPEWMCLVQWESSFNSSAIGGPNTNGSFDWGLFQINEGYWCTVEGVGNDCNVNCWGKVMRFWKTGNGIISCFFTDLVDDDLTDDFACVDIIYARHGFSAWNAWKSRCQANLEEFAVDECF